MMMGASGSEIYKVSFIDQIRGRLSWSCTLKYFFYLVSELTESMMYLCQLWRARRKVRTGEILAPWLHQHYWRPGPRLMAFIVNCEHWTWWGLWTLGPHSGVVGTATCEQLRSSHLIRGGVFTTARFIPTSLHPCMFPLDAQIQVVWIFTLLGFDIWMPC